jgi:hypothetical protein
MKLNALLLPFLLSLVASTAYCEQYTCVFRSTTTNTQGDRSCQNVDPTTAPLILQVSDIATSKCFAFNSSGTAASGAKFDNGWSAEVSSTVQVIGQQRAPGLTIRITDNSGGPQVLPVASSNVQIGPQGAFPVFAQSTLHNGNNTFQAVCVQTQTGGRR